MKTTDMSDVNIGKHESQYQTSKFEFPDTNSNDISKGMT